MENDPYCITVMESSKNQHFRTFEFSRQNTKFTMSEVEEEEEEED